MEQLIDIKGVAALLGVSASTIKNWVREKGLPCIRISRRSVRYSQAAVMKWALEHGSTPLPPPLIIDGGE